MKELKFIFFFANKSHLEIESILTRKLDRLIHECLYIVMLYIHVGIVGSIVVRN